MKKLFLLFLLLIMPLLSLANTDDAQISLSHVKINPKDPASLQRGAKLFINYCSGCHSLGYMRYNRMAKDIGIVNEKGEVAADLVKDNLIFTDSKITDMINIAMRPQDAKRWFGVIPPDLTLEARVRGIDWIYSYLLSFYQDDARPWGANNLIYTDVAMPNVLLDLQGVQTPKYRSIVIKENGVDKKVHVIDSLELTQAGSLSPDEFKQAVTDIVNFLAYVAEPAKAQRVHLGMWVLGFLVVLLIICYLLKREYWKDI